MIENIRFKSITRNEFIDKSVYYEGLCLTNRNGQVNNVDALKKADNLMNIHRMQNSLSTPLPEIQMEVCCLKSPNYWITIKDIREVSLPNYNDGYEVWFYILEHQGLTITPTK